MVQEAHVRVFRFFRIESRAWLLAMIGKYRLCMAELVAGR
jgi:hypothetical protein